MKYFNIVLGLCLSFMLFITESKAQQDTLLPYYQANFQNPKKVIIKDIVVKGLTQFDPIVVKIFTGLTIGQKVSLPGEEISSSIENLWKQKLFTEIQVLVELVATDQIILTYVLEEKPRLLAFTIKGLKRSKAKSLREELTLQGGDIVTENLKQKTANQIKKFYNEKGFLNTQVTMEEELIDEKKNLTNLRITVNRGVRTKVAAINFIGSNEVPASKLRRQLKATKQIKSIRFKRSKYIESEFENEKFNIVTYYNTKGYRDARILKDSIYKVSNNKLNIDIHVFEGPQYHFRHIKWSGNTKYRSTFLDTMLGIKAGDIYDLSRLESKLFMSANGTDISSLYMDDGYLFFSVTPIEVRVENDSIDIEVRINEGPQAIVNRITVDGNTKTSDYVIMRELRIRPGQKFSRADIQRSVRELAALGYFNPENIDVQPKPNYAGGTVDIDFTVEERPSDQIELSGGFGQGFVVGTLGLNLTNFSAKKMFKGNEWTPIPAGDGQRLSLRAQSNGTFFQSYNFSFTEPWFGGKRPNSLSFSVFHSIQTNGRRNNDPEQTSIRITGATLGLGKLLRKPDDFFTLSASVNFQHYTLDRFGSIFSFATGISDNINFRIALSRNSTDQPIFPRSGAQFLASLQITPPFSMINGRSYESATDQEKYRWLEYHKWKFEASWYVNLFDKLVLATMGKVGIMGRYNKDIGYSPFERFYLGGAGLIGFNLDGRELISFRGYNDNSVTPVNPSTGNFIGATAYNKFTAELRYPFSLNPQATIYGLVFAEGANSWEGMRSYNPFSMLRSAGGGVRIFLPMFGLLGVDYGYGFDENPYRPGTGKGQFHFFIGQQF